MRRNRNHAAGSRMRAIASKALLTPLRRRAADPVAGVPRPDPRKRCAVSAPAYAVRTASRNCATLARRVSARCETSPETDSTLWDD